jgi:serine/threonine protein kinase
MNPEDKGTLKLVGTPAFMAPELFGENVSVFTTIRNYQSYLCHKHLKPLCSVAYLLNKAKSRSLPMYYAGIVHWITSSSVPALVQQCASAALQSHPVTPATSTFTDTTVHLHHTALVETVTTIDTMHVYTMCFVQAISRMSPASDVWALGVTLCQMIYGKLPFWSTGSSPYQLLLIRTAQHTSCSLRVLQLSVMVISC